MAIFLLTRAAPPRCNLLRTPGLCMDTAMAIATMMIVIVGVVILVVMIMAMATMMVVVATVMAR